MSKEIVMEMCGTCLFPKTKDPVIMAQQQTCKCQEALDPTSVLITAQHAHSLIVIVQYLKDMIATGKISDSSMQWGELSYLYCDELLEGLKP